MLKFNNSAISKLIFHKVGNKFNDEELFLSNKPIELSDDSYSVFFSSLTKPFNEITEVNHFVHHSDLKLNNLYTFCSEIFEDDFSFESSSKKIAKHLYSQSSSNLIKGGDLVVCHFTEIEYNDIITDAIGIYKIERRNEFFKTYQSEDGYKVDVIEGIDTNKIDKSCLVVFLNKEEGFRVINVDKNNYDANYWIRDFLDIEVVNDNYQQTKNYLLATESFVNNQLEEDYEISKSEKINLFNRTVDFFKNNEGFEIEEFAGDVFKNPQVEKSYKKFIESYSRENELSLVDDFSISQSAVKKQSKIFKRIIKLDKNFHLYIHNDGEFLERGRDESGKNFYKIYYDVET